MTPPFELVTNFRSPTAASLRRAAWRAGGDVVVLDEVRDLGARNGVLGGLVFMYGYPEEAERQLTLLQAHGLPVALWQVDDPHYFRRADLGPITRRLARRADVYFSHTLELREEYAALGVTVEYLPTAAREVPGAEALVGPPPAEEEYERDYVFVGTPSKPRQAAFRGLQGLLPGLRGELVSGVPLVEALRLSRTSRVSLYLGVKSEPDGAPDGWGLSERSWEVPLVGGLLVQEDRRHLHDHFRVGEDAVAFRTIEECAEHVAWLCARQDERRAIAARAHARVLAEHRMDQRLARVIERLQTVMRTRKPRSCRQGATP